MVSSEYLFLSHSDKMTVQGKEPDLSTYENQIGIARYADVVLALVLKT